ncbi:MAG: hypothetical protein ACRYG8_27625, partial [Janthinobacterium lividum]
MLDDVREHGLVVGPAMPAGNNARSAPPATVSAAGAHAAYPPPAAMPTQAGARDIRFDFNLGARVVLPNRS